MRTWNKAIDVKYCNTQLPNIQQQLQWFLGQWAGCITVSKQFSNMWLGNTVRPRVKNESQKIKVIQNTSPQWQITSEKDIKIHATVLQKHQNFVIFVQQYCMQTKLSSTLAQFKKSGSTIVYMLLYSKWEEVMTHHRLIWSLEHLDRVLQFYGTFTTLARHEPIKPVVRGKNIN